MLSSVALHRPRAITYITLFALASVFYLYYRRLVLTGELGTPRTALTDPAVELDTSPIDDQLVADLATIPPMAFNTTARPLLHGITNLLLDLPKQFVPTVSSATSTPPGKKPQRLVFIGDVHGHLDPLEELLKKISFDRSPESRDHLILTGDLVNKGPHSAGVVALAMELGASAVRGNHEDTILLYHEAMQRAERTPPPPKTVEPGLNGMATLVYEVDQIKATALPDSSAGGAAVSKLQLKSESESELESDYEKRATKMPTKDDEEMNEERRKNALTSETTVKSLSPAQLAWLASLPVILKVGPIPRPATASSSSSSSSWLSSFDKTTTTHKTTPPSLAPELAPIANLVVVHAGLVPNTRNLADQDPWACMTMRSLIYPIDELRRNVVRNYLTKAARSRRPKVANAPNHGGRSYPVRVTSAEVELELARVEWAQKVRIAEEMMAEAEGRVGNGSSSADAEDHTEAQGHTAAAAAAAVQPISASDIIETKVAIPVDSHAGEPWTDAWNRAQERIPESERTTVVFGHDAKMGLNVRGRYTYGLDSGCVYGKQLTALVIEVGEDGGVKKEIVQVECEVVVKV